MNSQPLQGLNSINACFTFLLGLIFGSFLNVCIYRMPRGLSVVRPRSACPKCNAAIAWYDNIPVLSWLILRGRCRKCHEPITPRYAIVELMVGILFLICFLHFGGTSFTTLRACIFCFLITGLIFTDVETFLLPDALTLPGIALGIVLASLAPVNSFLELQFYRTSVLEGAIYSWRLLSVGDALLGALFGGGAVWLIGYIYEKIRHIEGMGFGDVKMMAMIGAFLGYENTLVTLFVGSICGSGFGLLLFAKRWLRRRSELRSRNSKNFGRRAWHSALTALRFQQMPFGVFLGGAALFSLFLYTQIVDWYLRLADFL